MKTFKNAALLLAAIAITGCAMLGAETLNSEGVHKEGFSLRVFTNDDIVLNVQHDDTRTMRVSPNDGVVGVNLSQSRTVVINIDEVHEVGQIEVYCSKALVHVSTICVGNEGQECQNITFNENSPHTFMVTVTPNGSLKAIVITMEEQPTKG
ncbi:hypothetical protein JKY72_01520 [Candidatus Gracilibacteria bacterium]|nr:hypothetical protein [Candidatus Gracilibacteria bacterium]